MRLETLIINQADFFFFYELGLSKRRAIFLDRITAKYGE